MMVPFGVAVLLVGLPACGSKNSSTTDTLRIGAYSVVHEVLRDGIIPAFRTKWKAQTGRDLEFEESYNASGAQARAIAGGFDADIAILSHEGDMSLLVKAGRVKAGWSDGPHKGIVTNSLVVIGHRAGNPKGIKDWSDLARPGVGVLYPDPKTSGGAKWNINAIYGSAYLASRAEKDRESDLGSVGRLLAAVQANVINMDQSGRQSMANFTERGTGDAAVTYENELLLHNKDRTPIPYVVPPSTLLIESPAALIDSSVQSHGNRKVAEAFLDFLGSVEGQRIFAEFGFRPVRSEVAAPTQAQPLPAKVFRMADLGGWSKIEEELYGPKGLWTSIFVVGAESKGSRR